MSPSTKMLKKVMQNGIANKGYIEINRDIKTICKYDDIMKMYKDAEAIAKTMEYKSTYYEGRKIYYLGDISNIFVVEVDEEKYKKNRL